MKKTLTVMAMAISLALTTLAPALAAPPNDNDETVVPGHRDRASGTVVGRYDSVYAYDYNGDYYWDLGDGRVRGTVGSVDDLDPETLTVCDYVAVYRGDFGADPGLDDGWVRNNIRCHGYDGNGTYNALYIHESDPRFTGDRTPIWTTWEVLVDARSGVGNVANSKRHAD